MNATNTNALADSLAKFAARIAPHMPLSERQQIIAAMTPDLVDASDKAQADINAIIAALAGPECDVLCKGVSPAKPQAASADVGAAPSGPQQFYPLIGKWAGKAKFEISGQNAIDLDMAITCQKTNGSTALECDMKASNSQVSLIETDLMGVDEASGKASWFFVDNQGSAGLDHVKWTNADTMTLQRAWEDAGKKMAATGTITVSSNTMDLRNEVTADGKTASVLSAQLTR